MKCPHCGQQIADENAVFCPYCSKQLNPKRHPSIPLASGTLTTISAIIAALAALITISDALSTYGGYGYVAGTNIFFWIAGIFEIAAFAAGLAGAVFQFRRRAFAGSILSNAVLITASAIITAQAFLRINLSPIETQDFTGLILLGIPLLALSILSVILIAVAKVEYK